MTKRNGLILLGYIFLIVPIGCALNLYKSNYMFTLATGALMTILCLGGIILSFFFFEQAKLRDYVLVLMIFLLFFAGMAA